MNSTNLPPAPFVNAELMQRYMNNNVRIVGKLHEENAMEVTIVTSDNKHVKVWFIYSNGGANCLRIMR